METTPRLRRLGTSELNAGEIAALRQMLWDAFADDQDGAFSEEDWRHALGGVHVVLDVDGHIVSHAALVERVLHAGGRPLRTGYVEAVATARDRQGAGFGTTVMRDVNRLIATGYELGALGTGRHGFYERLGWRAWRGPSFVRAVDGLRATPDDDGYIMVLLTPRSPPLDLDAAISCEWRPGDPW